MNSQPDQNKTVLYISELPENVVNSDLYSFFSDYKENIVIAQVDRNTRSYTSLGGRVPRATIIFKDHDKASEARTALNMRRLKGKTLNIMWHEKDNSVRYNNTANIFVKGINRTIKPRELYELFMQYGEIISSKICEDEDGNLLGYGYINYYNLESAEKAIKELNKKEFHGSILELEHFQKKNERMQSFMGNNSVYIKNIPDEMSEEEVKGMFKDIGTITWAKMYQDTTQRKFAIIVYASPELAIKAKETLNGKNVGKKEEELYVDLLQKKTERKRLLNTKIIDINSKLNRDFKECNLHVKNIPYNVKEEKLKEIFAQYGEIKSAKIQKFILVTKVKGIFKESEESRGFGYVCFTSPEAALNAINGLNNKPFPGYEDQKHPPIIINYFMPKVDRSQYLSKSQSDNFSDFTFFMGPMQYGNGMFPQYRTNYDQRRGYPRNMQKRNQQKPPKAEDKEKVMEMNNEEEPNLKFLNSIEGIEGKKEYLGEFLFKKIEKHPIAVEKRFTLDITGRITGMIIGIDDIQEIYEITTNNDNLTARIKEALTLLEAGNE